MCVDQTVCFRMVYKPLYIPIQTRACALAKVYKSQAKGIKEVEKSFLDYVGHRIHRYPRTFTHMWTPIESSQKTRELRLVEEDERGQQEEGQVIFDRFEKFFCFHYLEVQRDGCEDCYTISYICILIVYFRFNRTNTSSAYRELYKTIFFTGMRLFYLKKNI